MSTCSLRGPTAANISYFNDALPSCSVAFDTSCGTARSSSVEVDEEPAPSCVAFPQGDSLVEHSLEVRPWGMSDTVQLGLAAVAGVNVMREEADGHEHA